MGAFLVGSYSIFSSSDQNTWKGHFLFLGWFWNVVYVLVYFRKSATKNINPLTGLVFGLFDDASNKTKAVYMWLGNCNVVIPILLIFGDVTFAKASTFDIISMIILQGILIAILAMLLYNFAIRQLGPMPRLQHLER